MPSPLVATPPTVTLGQTLPRIQRCDAITGQVAAAFGFSPVTCQQTVGVRTFVTDGGLRVGFCSIAGHESSVRRRFAERRPAVRRRRIEGCATCVAFGDTGPSHDASPRCESGGRDHCSDDRCF